MSDAIGQKNIYAALAAAQAAMGPALKDSTNPAFKAKYADLSNVVDACLPALNANGIAMFQPTCEIDGNRYVKTVFAHISGETVECLVPLIVGKNDMQGYGSAVTYARRYGLMCMAGIAPEDDDGNAAVVAKPEPAPRKEEPPYNPAPHIAGIDAAVTGKALLAAINAPGCMNGNAEIAAARVAKLSMLIKGAQTLVAIEAFKANFGPDWGEVSADAEARRTELLNADLEGDKIPYGEDQQ